jgi:hypothetical protein
MAELAHMADKAQIVCTPVKVDAFIEMANQNTLADTADTAISADSQKLSVSAWTRLHSSRRLISTDAKRLSTDRRSLGCRP